MTQRWPEAADADTTFCRACLTSKIVMFVIDNTTNNNNNNNNTSGNTNNNNNTNTSNANSSNNMSVYEPFAEHPRSSAVSLESEHLLDEGDIREL